MHDIRLIHDIFGVLCGTNLISINNLLSGDCFHNIWSPIQRPPRRDNIRCASFENSWYNSKIILNTLPPIQDGHQFCRRHLQTYFLDSKFISNEFSLKYTHSGKIDDKLWLPWQMGCRLSQWWHRFLTGIFVTRPQWDNKLLVMWN